VGRASDPPASVGGFASQPCAVELVRGGKAMHRGRRRNLGRGAIWPGPAGGSCNAQICTVGVSYYCGQVL